MQSSAIGSVPRVATLSERIELLKWLGVVLMLWDHSKYLDWSAPGWQVLGRGAYPAFALAFGYALTVVPDTRGLLVRLLYAGLAAEFLGAWAVSDSDLNVMFSFALVAWLVHARRACRTPGAFAWRAVLALLVSPLVEYGVAGMALCFASMYYWGAPSWKRAGVLLAASLLLVVPNYSFDATFWLVGLVALTHAPIGLPRIKRAFYVVYVAQWPLLWVLS